MTAASDENAQQRYRSGDAARLAKMPVTTLRIWERRYGVITPPKSESGQRLYSAADVRRLIMLKQLVTSGHPIGTIARLDQAQLERLALGRSNREQAELSSGDSSDDVGISLCVVGQSLDQCIDPGDFDLLEAGVANLSTFANLEEAMLHASHQKSDALIVTVTSLHEDIASQVLSLGRACQTTAIALAYAFGRGRAIRMLRLAGVRLFRQPDSRIELRDLLKVRSRATLQCREAMYEGLRTRTARRFDDSELIEMGAKSSTIACECPRHLSELILKLSSFEKYSDECGSRSLDDAMLHRHLGDVANCALAMFESALARIAREEGL